MNIGQISMPLIRIAHPVQDELNQEFNRIEKGLRKDSSKTKQIKQNQQFQESDDSVKLADASIPRNEVVPNLFKNFEHTWDPELTPRKGWKARVHNLDAIIEQEKERYRQLERKHIEEKTELESDLVKMRSRLNEEAQKVMSLQQQLEQEQQLKEEYNRQAQRAKFDLDKREERFNRDREV